MGPLGVNGVIRCHFGESFLHFADELLCFLWSTHTAGIDTRVTLPLGMVQLLGHSHLTDHKGMVRVTVSTVVAAGEEDAGQFRSPGDDKVLLVPV